MKSNEKTLEYWIQQAQEIATRAHRGQFRNDNTTPYINHPIRVSVAVEDRLKPIALLHDSIEDSDGKVTLDTLREYGFPQYIITAVNLLTHKHGDSNMVYWKNILTNEDASKVKIADIRDNLGDSPSEYAKQKYVRALELFKQMGYSI